jgi:lipopolysaccharide exporter
MISQENKVNFHSVTAGGVWVMYEKIVKYGLSLLQTVILARLLGPEEFGVLGIGLLLIDIVSTFSQTGADYALIYYQTDAKHYYDSAWVLSIGRGIVVGCVLLLIAPLGSSFFSEPRAPDVIRLLALSKVVEGFANIGIVSLRRQLKFQRIFAFESTAALSELLVTVGLALWLRNVWAMTFGLLFAGVLRTGLSYVFISYRPSFRIDKQVMHELFKYGRWVNTSSIMQFILNEGDDLVAGRVFGSEVLGIYQMAYRLSNLPATQITYVINQVVFPTYAALQKQKSRLSRAYLMTLRFTSILIFPLSAGLIFLARPFVVSVLGEDWISTIELVQVLSVWGLTRAIWATTGPLYQAVGAPQFTTKLLLIRVVIQLLLIWPFLSLWGIVGIAWAVVVSALVVFPLSLNYAKNIIGAKWGEIIRCFFPASVGCVLLGVAILLINIPPTLSGLFLGGLGAVIFWMVGFIVVDGILNWEGMSLLYQVVGRLYSLVVVRHHSKEDWEP